jgi:pyruvate-formate lyase-activating enzyme
MSMREIVAEIFNCDITEVKDSYYTGLSCFYVDNKQIAIGDYTEVTKATEEAIKRNVWAFRADFILEHTLIENNEKHRKEIEEIKELLDDNSNHILTILICDMNIFMENAIKKYGRGMFLNSYDGTERKFTKDGKKYYYYVMEG